MTPAHDVILVGGGGAGLRAAIAIAEANPRLSIAVVSKVYPMRSHTVSAEGGAAGVIRADDSFDEHAYDTISGGDWLPDQDAVEAFVREASDELMRLEHWGCPWSREPDGRVAVRPFGGMKKMRTWFAADKTGFHMLHTLFQTSLKYTAVVRYDEWFVTRLLVDDGRVHGVVAIDLQSGRVESIGARAVIICTGGCGRVYPVHHQREHQERRRDGAGVPRGRPAQGHGVRAVPPDRAAVHRDPHHRSRARRGRVPRQQGRLSLPPGLRSRHAPAQAGLPQHGARAARPAVAGVRQGSREGPHHRHALRAGRAPGRPAPGQGRHRVEDPVRARAVPQVPERRPGDGDDSGASRSCTT